MNTRLIDCLTNSAYHNFKMRYPDEEPMWRITCYRKRHKSFSKENFTRSELATSWRSQIKTNTGVEDSEMKIKPLRTIKTTKTIMPKKTESSYQIRTELKTKNSSRVKVQEEVTTTELETTVDFNPSTVEVVFREDNFTDVDYVSYNQLTGYVEKEKLAVWGSKLDDVTIIQKVSSDSPKTIEEVLLNHPKMISLNDLTKISRQLEDIKMTWNNLRHDAESEKVEFNLCRNELEKMSSRVDEMLSKRAKVLKQALIEELKEMRESFTAEFQLSKAEKEKMEERLNHDITQMMVKKQSLETELKEMAGVVIPEKTVKLAESFFGASTSMGDLIMKYTEIQKKLNDLKSYVLPILRKHPGIHIDDLIKEKGFILSLKDVIKIFDDDYEEPEEYDSD